MFYSYPVVVPADTPQDQPVVLSILATAGVLHRLECAFPAGCQGMVHLVVKHQGTQIWPLDPDGDLSAEDFVIGTDDRYTLGPDTNELVVEAWSPGTAYDHSLTVRLGILDPSAFNPQSGLVTGLQKLLSLIGVS